MCFRYTLTSTRARRKTGIHRASPAARSAHHHGVVEPRERDQRKVVEGREEPFEAGAGQYRRPHLMEQGVGEGCEGAEHDQHEQFDPEVELEKGGEDEQCDPQEVARRHEREEQPHRRTGGDLARALVGVETRNDPCDPGDKHSDPLSGRRYRRPLVYDSCM
jgi:hypothetical protein